MSTYKHRRLLLHGAHELGSCLEQSPGWPGWVFWAETCSETSSLPCSGMTLGDGHTWRPPWAGIFNYWSLIIWERPPGTQAPRLAGQAQIPPKHWKSKAELHCCTRGGGVRWGGSPAIKISLQMLLNNILLLQHDRCGGAGR